MSQDNNLTPVEANPKIPRLNGDGFYEEGDRVIARDVTTGVDRLGTVGLTGSDGKGKDYMVVRYGEEPFLEAFICTESDVHQILPDSDDPEDVLRWLENGG